MIRNMNFKETTTSLLLLGILFARAASSALDWELQGEDDWNYDPVISYNAGPQNNNQGNPDQNQNNADWNPSDAQRKDSGTWESGRNQQQRAGRAWNPQDSQLKDEGNWNSQRGGGNWNPSDNQVKEDSGFGSGGNQRPSGQPWSPEDSQLKDDKVWGPGSNEQKRNWQPEDSQRKDDSTWGNRNNQGGQPWGGSDEQMKIPASWSNPDNQTPNRNWGTADEQRKDSGNWMPDDSQVKDTDSGNRRPSDGRWNAEDEQTKQTPPWDQGTNQQPPAGMWDSNAGMGWNPDNTRDDQPVGPVGIPADEYVPPRENPESPNNNFPGAPNQPPQGPFGSGEDRDVPSGVDENRPIEDSGMSRGDYGPNTGNDLGDTGEMAEGFPASNGRVPQGNYKGGDTERYPGDPDPSQWRIEDSIPGSPGVEYPNFSTIPTTGFDCKQHENPGYYGDVEARCQVFHICQADGRHDAFLCPIGTIFNQQYFVCVWWFNYNCDDTVMYYGLNADLYKGGHGGQGNFKGDSYNGGSTAGFQGDSFTTPGSVTNVNIGNEPGYGGPMDRQDVPRQDIRPIGDRGEENIPNTRPNEGIRPLNPVQGGNMGPRLPNRPTGAENDMDQPVIDIPVIEAGVGPGTGVDLPQGGSVGWKPDDGGKRNQVDSKRNWGSNQDRNIAQDKMGNNGVGNIGPNMRIKGGGWGNNNDRNRKSRAWDGRDDQSNTYFEKRWGSDDNNPADRHEDAWNSQGDVASPGHQEAVWLNRAYVVGEVEPTWNRNEPEYEGILGAGTSALARISPSGKSENKISEPSNRHTVLTSSQELLNGIRKRDDKEKSWRTDVDTVENKTNLQSGKKKWWRDAKIANILRNSREQTSSETAPYKKSKERKLRDDARSSLDNLNVYFDLNRDYTSDKSAKQRIWTLL